MSAVAAASRQRLSVALELSLCEQLLLLESSWLLEPSRTGCQTKRT